MLISASILKDSVSSADVRITSFLLTYPRYIHAELMTHRVFSRNAASSRAVPAKRMIQLIEESPVLPREWTANQAGMQGGPPLTGDDALEATKTWLEAAKNACQSARRMAELNVHKQYVNRITEPYAHISVVLTSTRFANWYALRKHAMAMPEIRQLASNMFVAHRASSPRNLEDGQWHLPFVDSTVGTHDEIVRSVACCARTSFLNHDKTGSSQEEDQALWERLLSSQPLHASPAEHQAMATGDRNLMSGNFHGWVQYRKTLQDEATRLFIDDESGDTWAD